MPHRTLPDRIRGQRAGPDSAVVTVDGEYYGTSPSQGSALPRSDHAAGWRQRFRPTSRGSSAAPRGQSLVEFGLILPLLFIFLLGVADFGRVFADGIGLEAATRNTSEAAAQEYLQLCRQYVATDPLCTSGLQPADYGALHTLALSLGCREAQRLTNRQAPGGTCTNPRIAVCVHDDVQGDSTRCGQEAPAPGGPCYEMDAAWSAADTGPVDASGHRRPYVEVRMCYRFDPLFSIALGNWGTVWLQKANLFVVTNY